MQITKTGVLIQLEYRYEVQALSDMLEFVRQHWEEFVNDPQFYVSMWQNETAAAQLLADLQAAI